MRDVAVKTNIHFDTFEQGHLNKYANKIDISIGLVFKAWVIRWKMIFISNAMSSDVLYIYGIHNIIVYESYLMGNNSIFVSKQYTFLYNNGQVCWRQDSMCYLHMTNQILLDIM